MPRRLRWSALSLALVLPSAPPRQPVPTAQAAAGYVVVVHASNPTPAMPREQVAKLFLRKATRWPSGAPALPVDLRGGEPAREAFTREVLGKSVPSVKAYWQARIFSGYDVPPPEQPSEAQAVAFVRANPGAVGYVSGSAVLPEGVRALAVGP
ncbi:hypothetical protein [Roseisolibacter sp. H3M3-2]|uniref:hypothetical protein n=1 Tax=Roseisolibacter sp. H3M3-2 TaxID=3031323 RepID=UPI0023DB37BA|nr:hypothetical protein [Roseisolibacter sp. H3M3-2]MDF1503666.1 hypothetical protein [Roseisolibacter sp. H3M3-2]